MSTLSIPIPSPDEIEAECQRLGHTLGWRFLTCPKRNIQSAEVALITVNPGGRLFEPAVWSVEGGSAYVIERWKNCAPGTEKLQRQVRRMFEIVGVDPANVLSGYLCPFRSPAWSALPRKAESLEFGVSIWSAILRAAKLKTVIGFGKDVAPDVARLFRAMPAVRLRAEWGDQTIDIYRFEPDGRLIFLPHLSRFGLFGHLLRENAFRRALEEISVAG